MVSSLRHFFHHVSQRIRQRIQHATHTCPDEKIRPVGAKQVGLTLLGTLACLILINQGAVLFLEYLNSNRAYFLVEHKWKLLLDSDHPVDWLVLGDSSCNQGVMPDQLTQILGGDALNACTVGSMLTLNHPWMLETYIQTVGVPRHVIIVHVYDIWHREFDDETIAHIAQIPLSPKAIRELQPYPELDSEERSQLFLARRVPIYANSRSLEEWIREPIQAFREAQEFTVTPQGFMPRTRPDIEGVYEDVDLHLEFVRDRSFEVSDINQQSLDRIRLLAETHGIDVYFAPSPIYAGLYENQDFRRYFRQMRRHLQDVSETSDRLHFVLPRPATFPAGQMQNTDHLLVSAADDYTRTLGRAIARHRKIRISTSRNAR